MPAPEQASLVEEGQPQTRQEAASTGPGMEPETTATTILASVKEQVHPRFETLRFIISSMPLKINLWMSFQFV